MKKLAARLRFRTLVSKGKTFPIRIPYFFIALMITGATLAGCAPLPTDSGVTEFQSVQPDSSPAPNPSGPPDNGIAEQPEKSGEEVGPRANQDGPQSTQMARTEKSQAETSSPEGKPSTAPVDVKAIPWSKVEKNSTMESCWIVLREKVYDFSPVVQQHPLGVQLSKAVCGKDATETFEVNSDVDDVILRLERLYLGPVR